MSDGLAGVPTRAARLSHPWGAKAACKAAPLTYDVMGLQGVSPRAGRLRTLPSTRTLSPPKAPHPTAKVNVSMAYDAHLLPSSPRLRPAPPPYAASSQPPPQPPSSSYANHEARLLPSPREAVSHRTGPREARQPLPLPMMKVHGGLMDQMSWQNFDQYVAKTGERHSIAELNLPYRIVCIPFTACHGWSGVATMSN
jgi:hypothetical protein